MKRTFALLALCSGVVACSSTVSRPADNVAFLEVSVTSELPGTEEAPAEFVETDTLVSLSVRALDRNAEPISANGPLSVRIRPGRIVDPDGEVESVAACPGSTSGRPDAPYEVEMVDGEWSGDVTYRYTFGPTRVWLTDDQGNDDREASYVTGVSDTLWYRKPTLSQMQKTDDPETNPLEREFVDVRAEDRELIVTALGAAGFWVTDTVDDPGNYAQLFVYTFNAPEEIVVGDRLSTLAGGNQEYLQSTQFSFPDYESAGDGSWDVPDAAVISDDVLCDDNEMEKYEGALLRAENVSIPSGFGSDTSNEDYADYLEYGQWPVEWADGDCTLYLYTATSIPDFLPTDWSGEPLDYVQGMATQVWDKWVLTVRGSDDLPSELTESSDSKGNSARPAQPPARPHAH